MPVPATTTLLLAALAASQLEPIVTWIFLSLGLLNQFLVEYARVATDDER